jgi:hypothetical protein
MSQRTDAEKARRINAEVRLLSRLNRCGADQLKCACPLCNGTVSMRVVRRDARGHVEQSRGACSTPDCLEWNQ